MTKMEKEWLAYLEKISQRTASGKAWGKKGNSSNGTERSAGVSSEKSLLHLDLDNKPDLLESRFNDVMGTENTWKCK